MSNNKDKKNLADIPLSVLDLATILAGKTPADTYKNSVDLAQHAESWGFKRYWLAEHHSMESIASSATSVLIGHIAEKTSTIRVGSGGIMLPNHSPLVIAEQFGTLEYMYPGRIDLGLGRAPGSDQVTARALRRNLNEGPNDFPESLMELKRYFSAENSTSKVRAIPGEGLNIPIWLLGSSTFSAQLAAYLGLPFAFASHFAPTYLFDALKLYRTNFNASDTLSEPYSLACINVVAADTDEEANFIATSFYQLAMGIIHGSTRPLQPPVKNMDAVWSEPERAAILQMMKYTIIGSAATVESKMQAFLDSTQVDEIMITSHIYDHKDRLRSYEIIAGIGRGKCKCCLKIYLKVDTIVFMKSASLSELKQELLTLPPKKVLELCLKLAKFKKENKELLNYLLFEAENESGYVASIKNEINEEFAELPKGNWYLAKKGLRKILRSISKYSKHTTTRESEVEMLMHFCICLKNSGIRYRSYKALSSLYDGQLKKLNSLVEQVHEDLRFDYKRQVQQLLDEDELPQLGKLVKMGHGH